MYNNCQYTAQGKLICKEYFSSGFDDNNPNIPIHNPCSKLSSAFANYISINKYNKCSTTSDINSCTFSVQCSDSNLSNTFNDTLAKDTTLLRSKCNSIVNPTTSEMILTCKNVL
jgi:hypothetical protein